MGAVEGARVTRMANEGFVHGWWSFVDLTQIFGSEALQNLRDRCCVRYRGQVAVLRNLTRILDIYADILALH
jgi:hypothetical protein